jgi:UDPglucose--hexose-1-phosphate uridylyltransferase
MGEMRQNRMTGEWVIYAPERGKRPHQHGSGQPSASQRPQRREDCPFCPGNEDALPAILMQLPEKEGESWQIRVVPNKFPALTPEKEPERSSAAMSIRMPVYGRQEVIIEHPRHDLDPASMSETEVTRLVEAYQIRCRSALEDRNINMVLVFRNHGAKAGTSLLHPHSQVIASHVVPAHVRRRERIAQSYYDDWGRCLLCDLLAGERKDPVRIVMETPGFTAFVPFAAEVPFEVWIVPRSHSADFSSITVEEKEGLAAVLRAVLRRLKERRGEPDYNYIINSAVRYKAEEPHLHWWLQIRPRLVTPAGFEIGSGIRINPTLPEDNAELLRAD